MICPGCQRKVQEPHPACLARVAGRPRGRARVAAPAPAREGIAGMTQSQRDAILRRIVKPKE